MNSGLLSGLRVLEGRGGAATRYCGRLFAVQGATVMQAGKPIGQGVGYGGAASAAYAAWLDGAKRVVPEDLRDIGKIDLAIGGQTPAAVEALDRALGRIDAGSVLRLGITWFAPDGPYRDWTGSDAAIQALCGVAYATGPKDGRPMLPRGHAPQTVAGATAFVAALAALIGKDAGWVGRRIDLNILDANLCFLEGSAASLALSGDKVVRRGVNRFTPTYPAGIYRASDGWIGVTALTPPQWTAFCGLIGKPELARDPSSLIALNRLNRADELDPILRPALSEKPAAYWLAEGQARRIPLAPVPNLAELPKTPHWVGRGSFGPVAGADGAVGPTLPYRIETRAKAASAPARRPAASMEMPLRGLKVLDLSMGWAGPLATRHLADLGADIVKVESCTHFDWWRAFDGPLDGDPPPYETRPSFLMVNRNKRGITLDLKAAAGKALVRKIAESCDVMIENYAPGVLDKLGIGPTALADAVPGLIGVSMGAFGAAGPWRGFRAYGSTVEQASGFPFVNGEADGPPTMQHVAYGDPIGGIYAAAASLVALYGQRQGRASRVVDLGQVECLFQLCADAVVAQSVSGALLARAGSRHPLCALRMVAATDKPARWIAVAVETAAAWNALAGAIGRHALAVPPDATLETLKSREDEMEEAVAEWALGRAASTAVSELQGAGVSAAPILAAEDLLKDPQMTASGFWRRAERRYIGNHVVPLAPYRIDGEFPPLRSVAPTLGEHNESVLAGDLGLARDELDALAANGVIGTRAVAGET
jgi:crotonobetainyl-CoA:carnitine CoA-transferase CaiB-like acyl-CoA transferase